MKCVSCTDQVLTTVELTEGLWARQCGGCGGHWLPWDAYVKWKSAVGRLADRPLRRGVHHHADSPAGIACCACAGRMFAFAVGGEVRFAVNRCFVCKGVWLDGGEWDALSRRQLHDNLIAICDGDYQVQVLADAQQTASDSKLRLALGDEYETLQGFLAWVAGSPHRAVIVRTVEAALRRLSARDHGAGRDAILGSEIETQAISRSPSSGRAAPG